MSAIGTSRHVAAMRNLVAIGGIADMAGPAALLAPVAFGAGSQGTSKAKRPTRETPQQNAMGCHRLTVRTRIGSPTTAVRSRPAVDQRVAFEAQGAPRGSAHCLRPALGNSRNSLCARKAELLADRDVRRRCRPDHGSVVRDTGRSARQMSRWDLADRWVF